MVFEKVLKNRLFKPYLADTAARKKIGCLFRRLLVEKLLKNLGNFATVAYKLVVYKNNNVYLSGILINK